jgi:hypothetical protein
MSKLEQLLKQQQDIAAAIEAEKNKGREEAVATVQSLCKQYNITLREVRKFVLERKPRAGKDGEAVTKKRVVRKTAVKRPRFAKK